MDRAKREKALAWALGTVFVCLVAVAQYRELSRPSYDDYPEHPFLFTLRLVWPLLLLIPGFFALGHGWVAWWRQKAVEGHRLIDSIGPVMPEEYAKLCDVHVRPYQLGTPWRRWLVASLLLTWLFPAMLKHYNWWDMGFLAHTICLVLLSWVAAVAAGIGSDEL